MTTRGLYVFKHDSKLGNARAYSLFARIQPKLNEGIAVPRDFSDYTVSIEGGEIQTGASREAAPGVTLIRRC